MASIYGRVAAYATQTSRPVSEIQVKAAAKNLGIDDTQVAELHADVSAAKSSASAELTVQGAAGKVSLSQLISIAQGINDSEALAILSGDTAGTDGPSRSDH